MDLDIQFGDLEESQPQAQLRPDRNKHFAVVACGAPADKDLPIFVDMDVMREMETHAQLDTSVELGGVMLGGQYEDDDGRPFVVVSDSLRAEHFEATKGSFKFTHDTWSQITRERDDFPADLQMVGWYHTHPDWGVFLSGMDMFICDNFFNKPLDLALVIDPCRHDRGMFQWTGEARQRIRRTGGFYLIASRFRQQELEFYAAQLEGKIMAPDPRFSGFPQGSYAPVVNVADTRNPWQAVAIMGMLTTQLLLLALIAWRMTMPPSSAEKSAENQTAAWEQRIEQLIEADRQAARTEAQMKVVERIVSLLPDAPDGLVRELEQQQAKADTLEADKLAHRALEEKLLREISQLNQQRDKVLATAESQQQEIEALQAEKRELAKVVDSRREQVAKLTRELNSLRDPQSDEVSANWNWTWIGIGAGAVLLICAIVGIALYGKNYERDDRDAQAEENPIEANPKKQAPGSK